MESRAERRGLAAAKDCSRRQDEGRRLTSSEEAWRKLGRVVEAAGGPFGQTHAMLPTPWLMQDRVRVFYASCDKDIRGRVFFADFEAERPFRLIAASPDPVLDVGSAGAFDCDGVNPSQALRIGRRLALFYIGWRRGPPEKPYTLFAGLALSDNDGESFERSPQPLLAPRSGERLFRTAPFVEPWERGYRMIYIGGDRFVTSDDGRRAPIYSLMALTSSAPERWDGVPRTLLEPDLDAGEIGFGRPVVYGPANRRRLMMSIRRRDGYQLVETDRAFAASVRPTMQPVVPEPLEAWESQMTCFGAVCSVGRHELLFYNGDGYGRSGFGLAWRRAAQGQSATR